MCGFRGLSCWQSLNHKFTYLGYQRPKQKKCSHLLPKEQKSVSALYEESLSEPELFSLEKRKFWRDLIAIFQYQKEAYKKAGEGLFTRACGN